MFTGLYPSGQYRDRTKLDGWQKGDRIARLAFYVNLTFVKNEDGVIYLHDKTGEERKYPKWMFLKYAKLD